MQCTVYTAIAVPFVKPFGYLRSANFQLKKGIRFPTDGKVLPSYPFPSDRILSPFAFTSREGHRTAWKFPIVDTPGAPPEQDPADRQF